MIRLSPVRVIGPDNEQIGVLETPDALRMAQERGLDLVEIAADSRPPVCKIMDYGKYRYDLSKRQKGGKSGGQELKEIRLGRSIKIDKHDVAIRVEQARKFLMAGHKVQITQRFRGREMMHKELGLERLREICEDLQDIAKVEVPPRWVGRSTSIVLAPEKNKIDAIKSRMSEEERKKAQEDLEKAERERLAALEEDETEGDEDGHEDAETQGSEDEGGKGRKKGKGPADDRATNPVDEEIEDLLN